ncbi:hypothetical protein [Vibrio sp. D431a]|uniref:hypothetical protein n=1 Tax=Vibrio sp. D431a TaxID=2837388 RepID=UPI0025550F92|nr:hypothetical protein [Vibrio sp. D431a]MDK9793774.1 hypothetical protein [Vibrio sp. D431a]
MELTLKGLLFVGVGIIFLVLLRHLTIAITLILVTFKSEMALVQRGWAGEMRSPSHYTAYTFATLFNLEQTFRFDRQIIESEVFEIDFRGVKPRYKIMYDKM